MGAAIFDAAFKGPEIIDFFMTTTMIVYSGLFLRFAWCVQPRNYILFSCHFFNMFAQLNQIRRSIEYKLATSPTGAQDVLESAQVLAVVSVGVIGSILAAKPLQKFLTAQEMPPILKNIFSHPAGPMTIFFWAPMSKWLLSINNLADLNKPTDTISLAQQIALTVGGCIWARYAMVITPVNYNLAIVNCILSMSSAYHIFRKLKADYI